MPVVNILQHPYCTMARLENKLVIKIGKTPSDVNEVKEFFHEYRLYLEELRRKKERVIVYMDARALRFSLDMKLLYIIKDMFAEMKEVSDAVLERYSVNVHNKHLAKLINDIVARQASPTPTLIHHDIRICKQFLKVT